MVLLDVICTLQFKNGPRPHYVLGYEGNLTK